MSKASTGHWNWLQSGWVERGMVWFDGQKTGNGWNEFSDDGIVKA